MNPCSLHLEIHYLTLSSGCIARKSKSRKSPFNGDLLATYIKTELTEPNISIRDVIADVRVLSQWPWYCSVPGTAWRGPGP